MSTILIIAHDPATHSVLRRVLCAAGFRAVATSTPEEALPLVATLRVDMVLQQIEADEKTGEVCVATFHALRARDPQLPFIFVTGPNLPPELILLRSRGAAECMSLPCSDTHLLRMVHAMLRSAGRKRLSVSTHRSDPREPRWH